MKEFVLGLLVSGAINAGISIFILRKVLSDLKGVTKRHIAFVERQEHWNRSTIANCIDATHNEEDKKLFTQQLREG